MSRSAPVCRLEQDLPPDDPVDAEERAGQFGSAGTDEAGKPEDLAAVQIEVDFASG